MGSTVLDEGDSAVILDSDTDVDVDNDAQRGDDHDANLADEESSNRVAEVACHIVDDVAEAHRVVDILQQMNHLDHACDTEVADIDIRRSPLGQGRVICISIYSGPDLDVGSGPGYAIWADTTKPGVMAAFKPWLESESARKVWHNYSFDRHVLYNEGVDVRGFGGDTMHMARLWDASRLSGYSLAALTEELTDQAKVRVHRTRPPSHIHRDLTSLFSSLPTGNPCAQISMKALFGKPKLLKSGKEGKQIELPDIADVQENPALRDNWVRYSCYDAKGTWLLHEVLLAKLKDIQWQKEGTTMAEYYERSVREAMKCRPFPETDLVDSWLTPPPLFCARRHPQGTGGHLVSS